MSYALIDAIHQNDQINEDTYFAAANDGQHILIADSLAELQAAAQAAREDGHKISSEAFRSLTDSDCEEQGSVRCGGV